MSGKLIKCQVKSSKSETEVVISSGTASNKKPYSKNLIDFICIWLRGSNRWFHIPIGEVYGLKKIRLGKHKSIYMKYLDNWNFEK